MPVNLRASRVYLVSAVLLAVLGSLMLYGYLHGLESRVARSGRLIRLPVALSDIPAGCVVRGDMLTETDFPDIYLLPSMLAEIDRIVGRVALHEIGAGSPFLADSLSGSPDGGRAALMLDPGRRAYPVDIRDNVVPLDGLKAGDRVDVIFVPPQGAAITVLRSARVLYLPEAGGDAPSGEGQLEGFSLYRDETSGDALLLSVAPEEAETLAEAEERGRLVLSVCPASRD